MLSSSSLHGSVPADFAACCRLFDNLQVAIGLVELVPDDAGRPYDCRFLEVNEAFGRIAGIPPSALAGRTSREIDPSRPPFALEEFGRVALGGEPLHFEKFDRLLGKWLEVRAAPLGEGRFVAVFSDITGRRRMEEELKTTRERLLSILEHAPSGICVSGLPPDGEISYLNNMSVAITGYERSDCPTLKEWYERAFPDPAYRAEVIESLRRDFEGGYRTRKGIYRVTCKDGTVKEVQFRASALPDGTFIAFANDVSEIRRTWEALRESEERFRSLVENALDGVALTDEQGRVIEWNPAQEAISGLPRPAALGRPLWEIQSGLAPGGPGDAASRERLGELYRRILATGELPPRARIMESALRRPDGERRIVQSLAFVIRTEKGFRLGGISRDVTAQRQAEEASRRSEERFRQYFNLGLVGMAIESPEGGWIEVNDRLCEIYGYPREELMARHWRELTHPDDLDKDLGLFRRLQRGEIEGYSLEKCFIRRDGGVIDCSITVSCSRQPDGAMSAVFALVMDITDRKRAERDLRLLTETLEHQVAERTRVAEKRARQLQAMARQLAETEERERRRIAGVLHDDLQQLLAGARFKLETLCNDLPLEGTIRPLARQLGGILDESIRKTRHLSHEISPPILHRVGLSGILEWLARRMEAEHGLSVRLRAGEPVAVEDRFLRAFLFQAVRELLFNAAKHAGVAEAAVSMDHAAGRLTIIVSDQGKGFDPASLREVAGAADGLGLQAIAERIGFFGGSLRVESTPGQGSRFVLTVPLREDPLREDPLREDLPPEAAPGFRG